MDSSAKKKHLHISNSRENQHVHVHEVQVYTFLRFLQCSKAPSSVSTLGGHLVVLPNPTPRASFEEKEENCSLPLDAISCSFSELDAPPLLIG